MWKWGNRRRDDTDHRKCRQNMWDSRGWMLQESEQQEREMTYSPVGCSYLPVAGVSRCAERDMIGCG